MANRILGVIVALILGGSAVYLARPYIDYRLYAATDPRPIEARGDEAVERVGQIDRLEAGAARAQPAGPVLHLHRAGLEQRAYRGGEQEHRHQVGHGAGRGAGGDGRRRRRGGGRCPPGQRPGRDRGDHAPRQPRIADVGRGRERHAAPAWKR